MGVLFSLVRPGSGAVYTRPDSASMHPRLACCIPDSHTRKMKLLLLSLCLGLAWALQDQSQVPVQLGFCPEQVGSWGQGERQGRYHVP
jgi:hypothetical protein